MNMTDKIHSLHKIFSDSENLIYMVTGKHSTKTAYQLVVGCQAMGVAPLREARSTWTLQSPRRTARIPGRGRSHVLVGGPSAR